jgi:lysozyme
MVPVSKPYALGDAGVSLIIEFEGFRATAYQDVAGIWTIGYGSTRINGRAVVPGQTITAAAARQALKDDARAVAQFLGDAVSVPLSQLQVDALICFCYNVGVNAFHGSSLRRMLNAKQPITEPMFTAWNKIRDHGILVVSDGLTRRRKAEFALFQRGL